MLDREPFLKAIFAAPDDDLPRLVFADYLDEKGEAAWAELIRVSCERAHLSSPNPPPVRSADIVRKAALVKRQDELHDVVFPGAPKWIMRVHRGFLAAWREENAGVVVPADELADPEGFRLKALREHPEWYGASRLKVTGGRVSSHGQLATILNSPVTLHVTSLDLSGQVQERPANYSDLDDEPGLPVIDLDVNPVITVPMVVALAQAREARRLTDLDLTDNDLDNDAARALAHSPHLIRLHRLAFSHGNRIRGRTWQLLVERFGSDVME